MRALITIINSETFIKIIVVITIILFCVVAFWTGSRLADRYQANQIDWEQRQEKMLENIIEKPVKKTTNSVLENFNKQDKSTKLLAYKVILEKFNDKYKDLADNQKILLKEYVNSVTNSPSLKLYINEEIKKVKKELTNYSKKVKDKAIVIKLKETKDLIKPLCKKSSVHDDNVSNLLNYYELVNELKTIHG